MYNVLIKNMLTTLMTFFMVYITLKHCAFYASGVDLEIIKGVS